MSSEWLKLHTSSFALKYLRDGLSYDVTAKAGVVKLCVVVDYIKC